LSIYFEYDNFVVSKITIFQRPWTEKNISTRTEWFQQRREILSYKSTFCGESAAEEAFEITNAPKECLNEQKQILQKSLNYRGPSLSVGDIVRVEPTIRDGKNLPQYFMCKSFGWEKFNGDIIQLLRHLIY